MAKDRSTPGSFWLDAHPGREQYLKELNSARNEPYVLTEEIKEIERNLLGLVNLLREDVKRWRSNDLTAHFGDFFSPCYDGFRNAERRLSLNQAND